MGATDPVAEWLADLERRQYSPHTLRSYAGVLGRFSATTASRWGVKPTDATPAMLRAFLGEYTARRTIAQRQGALASFFSFCERREIIERSPMAVVERARPAPDDDRRGLRSQDVAALLSACVTDNELVCVGLLAYMGARRAAVAALRWRDVDIEAGLVYLREKGDRDAARPIPTALARILRRVPPGRPDQHVVSAETPRSQYRAVREILARVARRAGIDEQVAHPHALRAAFAVQFLESNPGQSEALQALMGHANPNTTGHYLARFNRQRAMRRVTDLVYT